VVKLTGLTSLGIERREILGDMSVVAATTLVRSEAPKRIKLNSCILRISYGRLCSRSGIEVSKYSVKTNDRDKGQVEEQTQPISQILYKHFMSNYLPSYIS
jgi:hypothetical protein